MEILWRTLLLVSDCCGSSDSVTWLCFSFYGNTCSVPFLPISDAQIRQAGLSVALTEAYIWWVSEWMRTLLDAGGLTPSAPRPGLLRSWPGPACWRCTAGPTSCPWWTANTNPQEKAYLAFHISWVSYQSLNRLFSANAVAPFNI